MQRIPLPAPEIIRALPPDGGPEFNRLIHETSPYLLQHARNPVDWYPWSEEARARARTEDKPIFLSIGYSSCHWCHVMERESFENPEIAAILNERFVPVKVDREERPDLDDLYMIVTQLMTGRGGWPNSLWLLPDGRPWYAGTYFPPDDRGGRLGFKTLLLRLSDIWRTRRADVEEQASRLSEAIAKHAGRGAQDRGVKLEALVDEALRVWRETYDPQFGGFGSAPKFPPHSALDFLLGGSVAADDPAVRGLATGTLDAIARGGIHDHIGGGFHRYSTDERWLLPHFEKMLYDNAQLARVFARAFSITRIPEYEHAARSALDWIAREMTGPEGGFYSALDADSDGEEGRFYVWSRAEIMATLGPDDGARFCELYQIQHEGNYRDEATGRPTGLNIPHLHRWLPDNEKDRMATCRARLRQRRDQRARPGLDDKCLTGWNGSAISAFAYAAQVFGSISYLRIASKAAAFLLDHATVGGELMRSWRAGRAQIPAFLEDYAGLIGGLLALRFADGHEGWVDEAERLARVMLDRFQDPLTGLFYPTSDRHEKLLARMPDYFDQAMPSAAALAIDALMRLHIATKKSEYRTAAERALVATLPLAARYPAGCAALLRAGVELARLEPGPRIMATPETSAIRPGSILRVALIVEPPIGRILKTNSSGRAFDVEAEPPFALQALEADHVVLRLPEDFSSPTATGHLRITYQACSDSLCLPPQTAAVSFEVSVKH